MLKNIAHLKNSVTIQSGHFLSIKAAARRKRQASNASVTMAKKIRYSFSPSFSVRCRVSK